MEELTMTYEQAVAFLKKYMEENGRKQVGLPRSWAFQVDWSAAFSRGRIKRPTPSSRRYRSWQRSMKRKRSHRRSRILWKLPSAVP